MKTGTSGILWWISLTIIGICLLVLIVTGIFGIDISNRAVLILAGITLVVFPLLAWTTLRKMRARFEGNRTLENNAEDKQEIAE